MFSLSLPTASAERDSLVIALMLEDGAARSVFSQIIKEFESAQPGLKVRLWVSNDTGYKEEIRRLLASKNGPDIVYWQAGRSLEHFVNMGLIEPIDDVWQHENWDRAFPPNIKEVVSVNAKVFGLPYSYYSWGFYYRKSILKKYKLPPPVSWNDFLLTCETLKENGITPITIGTKYPWTTGSWFDYLNLRINGLQFHRNLLKGDISFNDPRVEKVFEHWKVIIDENYFLQNHRELSWRESIPYVYRGLAGMTLIGNFAAANLHAELSEDVGFFRFPIVDETIGSFEEAPTDALIIPRNSSNKKSAKAFLKMVANGEAMASLNDALGTMSPHTDSPVSNKLLSHHGVELLKSADGYSQYFDRDSNNEFATSGFDALARFMEKPDTKHVIEELEAARLKFLRPKPPGH